MADDDVESQSLMDPINDDNEGGSDDPDDGTKTCPQRYEGDQFIWDLAELNEANKTRDTKQQIVLVRRDFDFDYSVGMRAHPDMDWRKSLKSLIVPWHNEWLSIWFYIGFAVYFWIQLIIIMNHVQSQYDFKSHKDFEFMFIATFGIASSLTMTAFYLIFYSQANTQRDLLDAFDYMWKLIGIYLYSFAFIGSELEGSRLYFPFLLLVIIILAINLVLVQYDFGRRVTFWISIGILAVIYMYDFWIFSTAKQKKVFYIPIFVEGLILVAGYALYRYEIPERWCRKSRFTQLYLTGWILFTILLISFIYEAHCILYYTLKLNRGNFDEIEDDWWRINNMFHQDDKS